MLLCIRAVLIPLNCTICSILCPFVPHKVGISGPVILTLYFNV